MNDYRSAALLAANAIYYQGRSDAEVLEKTRRALELSPPEHRDWWQRIVGALEDGQTFKSKVWLTNVPADLVEEIESAFTDPTGDKA